ncbi:MAG: peptide deformylase [Cyanobacteria bacterium P01_A01_bin.84]
MSTLPPIIEIGNSNLRKTSSLVRNIQDKTIQKLIDDLISTTIQVNGVGIAAPQVDKQDRLFIVASRPNLRYPHAPSMEPTAMINPVIVNHSNDMVDGWEGCLSVPGVRGLVPRYKVIEIKYTDRNGQLKQLQLVDFVARIFQHEYDHLEGILFVDRVKNNADLISEEEYQKQIGIT